MRLRGYIGCVLLAWGCTGEKDGTSGTECEVWYDGCSDPCTPLCVLASEIPTSTCDLGCSTPEDPPGECVWTGSGCDWE